MTIAGVGCHDGVASIQDITPEGGAGEPGDTGGVGLLAGQAGATGARIGSVGGDPDLPRVDSGAGNGDLPSPGKPEPDLPNSGAPDENVPKPTPNDNSQNMPQEMPLDMPLGGTSNRSSCDAMTAHWNALNPEHMTDAFCVESIDDTDAWDRLTASGVYAEGQPAGLQSFREVKFFLPFRGRIEMADVFTNSIVALSFQRLPIHHTFSEAFLRDLYIDRYDELYDVPAATRVVNLGSLSWREDGGGGRVWIWDVGGSDLLSCDDQVEIHRQLMARFALRPLFRAGWKGSTFRGSAPPLGCALPTWVPVN